MNRMKVREIQFTAKDMATAKEYVINRLAWKCIAKGKWTIAELHGGKFKAEHRATRKPHQSLVICGNEVTIVN